MRPFFPSNSDVKKAHLRHDAMTSILFNPITIALASMAAIVMATAFVPTDAWDRIKDRFWHSDSQGEIIPRQWPWEKH